MANWNIKGQYMETCNCTFICPCIGTNLAADPTEGDCKAAITMKIDEGGKDGVSLGGLGFIVLMHSPGPMGEGDITVGLIIDENADDTQTALIGEIASGAAGGPMAALAPLVSKIAGIEKRAVSFDADGMNISVKAGELIDQACAGVPSMVNEGEPVYIANTLHPANSSLGLAKAVHSHFHAFGIDWDDTSGTRNGHFAPFDWSG